MRCPQCGREGLHLLPISEQDHWYCAACSVHFAVVTDEMYTIPNDQFFDMFLPKNLRQFEGRYVVPGRAGPAKRSSRARQRRPKVKLVLIQGGKA